MEEVIKADLENLGRGGIASDVSAELAVGLICSNDHSQCIPPYDGRNSILELDITWMHRLFVERNGVPIARIRSDGRSNSELLRVYLQFLHQELATFPSRTLDDGFERLEPFAGFERIGILGVVLNRDRRFCRLEFCHTRSFHAHSRAA